MNALVSRGVCTLVVGLFRFSLGMSADLQLGAVVLSTDCSYVALVKRSSSNLWGFPRSSVDGKKHQEAAKHAVRLETGIVLSDSFHDVTFEV